MGNRRRFAMKVARRPADCVAVVRKQRSSRSWAFYPGSKQGRQAAAAVLGGVSLPAFLRAFRLEAAAQRDGG